MIEPSIDKNINLGIKRVQYGIIHCLPTESPGIAAARRFKQKTEIEKRLKSGEVLEEIQKDMGIVIDNDIGLESKKSENQLQKDEGVKKRFNEESNDDFLILHEDNGIKICHKNIDDKKGRMKVEGKLIISNMKILKSLLINNLKKHKELEIILEEVHQIDLSCIQLLYFAKKSKTKKVLINAKLNNEINGLLANTGFLQILNS